MLIAPFLPAACKVGRPRKTDLRSVVEAILYMASTGCQWRAIPKGFPPYSTVQGYFYAWSHQGLLAQINHMLVMALLETVEREAKAGRGDSRSGFGCYQHAASGKAEGGSRDNVKGQDVTTWPVTRTS